MLNFENLDIIVISWLQSDSITVLSTGLCPKYCNCVKQTFWARCNTFFSPQAWVNSYQLFQIIPQKSFIAVNGIKTLRSYHNMAWKPCLYVYHNIVIDCQSIISYEMITQSIYLYTIHGKGFSIFYHIWYDNPWSLFHIWQIPTSFQIIRQKSGAVEGMGPWVAM